MENPSLTESTVRDFGSRVISTIIAHSRQAQQIKDLQEAQARMNEQLAQLRSQADQTGKELGEAYQLVTVAEQERDRARASEEQAKLRINQLSEELARAQDALGQRDQRIAELEQSLATRSREATDWADMYGAAEQTAEHLRQDVSFWSKHAQEVEENSANLERQVADLTTAKEKAEAVVRDFQSKARSLFEPVPVPEAKPEPEPDPKAPEPEAAQLQPWWITR